MSETIAFSQRKSRLEIGVQAKPTGDSAASNDVATDIVSVPCFGEDELWQLTGLLQLCASECFVDSYPELMNHSDKDHDSVAWRQLMTMMAALSPSDPFDEKSNLPPIQDANASYRLTRLQRLARHILAMIGNLVLTETEPKMTCVVPTPTRFTAIDALRDACHHTIRQATLANRFLDAVESSARRQVYQLAYGLTHEINNPLANISARAQRLLATANDDRDRKTLATIVDQSARAHEMLAEIMHALQRPPLKIVVQDIHRWLGDLTLALEKRAEAGGVTLLWQVPVQKLEFPHCSLALREAIGIGFQNALEICQRGDTVQIIIVKQKVADGKSEVRIAIWDNGLGMSAAQREKAWDLCYSGREAGRGLGLGLPKLRRIIEEHHGRVWLKSQPNSGTSLEMRMPGVFA